MAYETIVVPLDDIQLDYRLNYVKRLITITDKIEGLTEQGSESGQGLVVTLEGIRVDLGAQGGEARALSRSIRS